MLKLTYAGLLYFDRTLPLLTGDVQPDGIDLEMKVFPRVEDLFRRQARTAEFPVAEMSMGTFMAQVSRGCADVLGLPIFLSRHFRHREVYVNAAADVAGPEDLRGKRIGVPEYQMTAAIWVRAFLQHDYGVRPGEIEWFTGGLRDPAYEERLPVDLASDLSVQRISRGQTLEEMLEAGEIDALITTEQPSATTVTRVRRLFPEYGAVEREYYARTGFFPIMHLVVVRRDVYDANPWLAKSLTEAFGRAKTLGHQRMRFQPSLPVALPWLQEAIEEVDAVFGGDAFPYGVGPNQRELEAMTGYAYEQGLTMRKVGVEELFADEVMDGQW